MRLAALVMTAVVLASCGGDGEGRRATSQATTSVPATTAQVESTTTAAPPSTAAGATSTTARGATTTRAGAATTTSAPRPGPATDFAVDYPAGWGPSGQVLATAFAAGATCGSALIVDNAGPAGSGPGASVEQSFVQVCWKGQEGRTLAQFMAATYGTASTFQPTTLAGRPAQVSKAGTSSTYFVDTSSRRYQVTTGVTAPEALRATRQAQVDHVLASLTLPN